MAGKKGGGGGVDEQPKQRLTAVLLADSFTQRFRPITVERPKVLLPLVNAPMLEYTLEWLAMNKVEEVRWWSSATTPRACVCSAPASERQ